VVIPAFAGVFLRPSAFSAVAKMRNPFKPQKKRKVLQGAVSFVLIDSSWLTGFFGL
jgi:hypothetical protein